jgi:hypothetical protein
MQTTRSSIRMAAPVVVGLMVAAAPLAVGRVRTAAGQQPAQAAQAQTGQATQGLVFGADAGLVFNVIRADKTADFEMVMGRVKDALQKSENPIRKQQAAGWKVFRAQEPDAKGNVLYLYVLDPAVKDADYTVSRILAEVFPTEAQELWPKFRDAYAAGQNRLNLNLVADFGR